METILFNGKNVPCATPVVDGRHVPTTDKRGVCWFDEKYKGLRKRKSPIRAVALHYTAGEGGSPQVFNTLKTRKNAKGELLNLGIHFTIDNTGRVVQHCDIAHVVQHIGAGNEWTVGIEVSNRAVGNPLSKPVRETIDQTIHGRRGKFLKYLPAQEVAIKSLINDLCDILGLPKSCPKDSEGRLITGLLGPKDLTTFRGVIGHFHISGAKRDPLPYILEQLF